MRSGLHARPSTRRRILLPTLIVTLLLLLVAILLVALLRSGRADAPSSMSIADVRSHWTAYGGQDVPLYEGMARSAFAEADFTASENGRITYPGAQTGIDVSEHQGEIDWQRVAADGIDWAVLRIGRRGYTEGNLFEDATYAANYAGATGAGLEVGVYFFSQAVSVEEAEEEAHFALNLLNGQPLSLPVVFDWEENLAENSRTRSVSSETITAMTNAFCSIVREAGYEPMVYLSRYAAYRRISLPQLGETPIWIASYNTSPLYYYPYAMWQYTHEGTVDGVGRTVDLNLRMPLPAA